MNYISRTALVILCTVSVIRAEPCQSFRDSRGRSSIDFAPPKGFVDICSRDFQLCVMLTEGYPRSVQTIGYFVSAEQWQRFQERKQKGFTRYFIAQRGRTLSKEEFADFKRYVHSQQGNIADHTDLPRMFQSQDRAPLGVTDEAENSISFGTVLKLKSANTDAGNAELLASMNIALQLNGESLSLYVFDSVKDVKDTEGVKALAKRWLKCIRDRNKK
jgi:hypothetical protein